MPGDRHHSAAFALVQAVAADLSSGELSFPTFTRATVRIRQALADPAMDLDRVVKVISTEPLLPVRIVQIANSAAMSTGGRPIADVKSAVMRTGLALVRSTAVAIALEQLRAAKDVQVFHAQAEWAWKHSLEVAATSYVLAKRLAKLNADEAMFAGLVHDIGRFYLLHRATRFPGLGDDEFALEGLLHDWHGSIGQALLHEFMLPDSVLKAVAEHENHRVKLPLREVCDVVTLANLLSHKIHPTPQDAFFGHGYADLEAPEITAFVDEYADEIRSLTAALRG